MVPGILVLLAVVSAVLAIANRRTPTPVRLPVRINNKSRRG